MSEILTFLKDAEPGLLSFLALVMIVCFIIFGSFIDHMFGPCEPKVYDMSKHTSIECNKKTIPKLENNILICSCK